MKTKIDNQQLFKEYFYGVQNKYTDNMDFYDKQEKELDNNLTYFNTYSATYSDNGNKKSSGAYSKNSKRFTLTHTIDTHTIDTHTIDTDFIKNIKIKNLSGEYIIRLLIGGQIIFTMYSDIYNVVVKKFQISDIDKDFVVIPLHNIVYPRIHSVEIEIYSDIENIEVFYDIYKYDSVNDPMNIINKTFFNLEKMTTQIQYTGEDSMDTLYRMNYNHPINSLAVNIQEEFDNSAMLKLDEYKLKLTPSYRVGEFVVYDFPYINFSKVYNAQFVIENENFTPLKNFKMFAFNTQPIRSASGMSGLMFTK